MTEQSNKPQTNDASNASMSAPVNELNLPVITSDALLQGKRAVLITHAGEQYRLLVTKNDKLILQK